MATLLAFIEQIAILFAPAVVPITCHECNEDAANHAYPPELYAVWLDS